MTRRVEGRHCVLCIDHKIIVPLFGKVINTLHRLPLQLFVQVSEWFPSSLSKACEVNGVSDRFPSSEEQHRFFESWFQVCLWHQYVSTTEHSKSPLEEALINFLGVEHPTTKATFLPISTCFTWLKKCMDKTYCLQERQQCRRNGVSRNTPGRNNDRNFSGIRTLTAVKISHRSRF